ncbi:MAG: hypothetical protein ACJAVV_001051, partial [Alphaproteobacteria bacterium]
MFETSSDYTDMHPQHAITHAYNFFYTYIFAHFTHPNYK